MEAQTRPWMFPVLLPDFPHPFWGCSGVLSPTGIQHSSRLCVPIAFLDGTAQQQPPPGLVEFPLGKTHPGERFVLVVTGGKPGPAPGEPQTFLLGRFRPPPPAESRCGAALPCPGRGRGPEAGVVPIKACCILGFSSHQHPSGGPGVHPRAQEQRFGSLLHPSRGGCPALTVTGAGGAAPPQLPHPSLVWCCTVSHSREKTSKRNTEASPPPAAGAELPWGEQGWVTPKLQLLRPYPSPFVSIHSPFLPIHSSPFLPLPPQVLNPNSPLFLCFGIQPCFCSPPGTGTI